MNKIQDKMEIKSSPPSSGAVMTPFQLGLHIRSQLSYNALFGACRLDDYLPQSQS